MLHQLQRVSYWLFAISYWLFSALPAHAGTAQDILAGLKKTAIKAGLRPQSDTAAAALTPSAFAGQITGVLLSFVGVIFFALALWGGIMWMTARGNEEKVKKAQELLKSAVMGLVIVFLAYSVTNFVLRLLLRTAG